MTFHSTSLATLATALTLLTSCWTGADSQGLGCENNTHCGLGLDCISGFCGGEPSDALCGNGYLDHDEVCDEGAQNAENGACRLDCTLELCGDGVRGPTELCDEGEQNDNEGACRPDCTPETCGDGFVGPGEVCDGDDGPPCSSMCTLESCGNGSMDLGEACDDGGESATCNDDCTLAECGDTKINASAGEVCDNDSPASDDLQCLSNCTVALLWDDMELDTPEVAWSHELVSGDPAPGDPEMVVMDTWSVGERHLQGMRTWDSGIPANGGAGDIRLSTPVIDLGPLTGKMIELRFDHARILSDCDDNVAYEGAVVEVSVDGGAYQIITPDGGYPGTVASTMLCNKNPLAGEQAFTLDETAFTTATFDLSAYAGSSIRVGFRAGWDCGNCQEFSQAGRGWFIDNVIVARSP